MMPFLNGQPAQASGRGEVHPVSDVLGWSDLAKALHSFWRMAVVVVTEILSCSDQGADFQGQLCTKVLLCHLAYKSSTIWVQPNLNLFSLFPKLWSCPESSP